MDFYPILGSDDNGGRNFSTVRFLSLHPQTSFNIIPSLQKIPCGIFGEAIGT
jgi:hypothetical protein